MRSINRSIAFFLLITGFTATGLSQNIMSIDHYTAGYNDTVDVGLMINNRDPFISFQCDIFFDEKLTYIEESPSLTYRKADHVLIDVIVSSGHLRFISYSNSNSSFSDTAGAVLHFKLVTSDQPGEYPITIGNAIIGNENSQNILNGTDNGNISMPGSFIASYPKSMINATVFPNPFSIELWIDVNLYKSGYYIFTLIASTGTILNKDIVFLHSGANQYDLYSLFKLDDLAGGIYFLIIQGKGFGGLKTFRIVKIK